MTLTTKCIAILFVFQLPFFNLSHAQFEEKERPSKSASEFTVANNSDFKVRIQVFLSDDLVCSTPKFSRSVAAGGTKTISCRNPENAFERCKIRVRKSKNGNVICKNRRNTCSKSAINMPNGSDIVISDAPTLKSKVFCKQIN